MRLLRVLTAIVLLGIFGGAARGEPVKIRIAWATVPGQLTPVLFAKTDVLRHLGRSYIVEHLHFAGAGPMVTALATGDIDIAQLAPSALGAAIENAGMTDVRVITDGYQDGVGDYYSSAFLVRKDSPIQTVADLKGKVVAVNALGGALDIAVRAMLRMHHLEDRKDYSIVEAEFPNLSAMLESSKADMIGLVLPFSDTLEKRGTARILFRMKDALGKTQMLFNAARAGFLDKNRAALADFCEDYVRAQHWFLDAAHRDEAIEIVAQFNKRPASVFSPYLFAKSDFYRDPDARPDLEALRRNMATLKELGFLKTDIDVTKYADLSCIEEGRRRAGAP